VILIVSIIIIITILVIIVSIIIIIICLVITTVVLIIIITIMLFVSYNHQYCVGLHHRSSSVLSVFIHLPSISSKLSFTSAYIWLILGLP